jgi:DNA polymerase-3 subunit delta'
VGFSEFQGNSETLVSLREMLARQRLSNAVIFAGPEGVGKYTLSLMLARAMNCLNPRETDGLPDFCGVCSNCTRIGQAEQLQTLFAEAVEAREGMRDTDKRETRIFVQTHPDVLIIPPDPPQMMIKVDQVRYVINTIRFRPAEGRRKVFIFTDSAFIKEAANALLKVLEEPPEYATIFLLARNTGELLTTIRSRCVIFRLAPLPLEKIEQDLAQHRSEWNACQRELVARLSGGAVGMARTLDLAEYIESRKDALALLHAGDSTTLFHTTENYRAGAEGKEKTDKLMRALYSLLRDLLALNSGTPGLVRNIDIAGELQALGRRIDFQWITQATQQMGQLQSGMRRNVLRSLALDGFALSLER